LFHVGFEGGLSGLFLVNRATRYKNFRQKIEKESKKFWFSNSAFLTLHSMRVSVAQIKTMESFGRGVNWFFTAGLVNASPQNEFHFSLGPIACSTFRGMKW
jgi:hypothetical protein